MKKILITGSTGFIGKNLLNGLEGNFEIFAPSRAELDLLDSFSAYEFIKKNKIDTVIHCAAYGVSRSSTQNQNEILKNNLQMFFNLEKCSKLYKRMICLGSGAEYDKEHYVPKMKESFFDTFVPQDAYGFSKYIISKYAITKSNIYILRIFGCFGKYEDWKRRFISNACCKALFGMDITINKNVLFDYLYVEDLIRIIEWFIDCKNLKYQDYNVCTGKSVDLLSLAKKIVTISKKNIKITVKNKGRKMEYSGDNQRLLKELGGFKFTKVEIAIEELYRWYECNENGIDKKGLSNDIS